MTASPGQRPEHEHARACGQIERPTTAGAGNSAERRCRLADKRGPLALAPEISEVRDLQR